MEKLIPINITKGHVSSIHLSFNDRLKKVDVDVTVELRTEMNEKVSEITLRTNGWNEQMKIDLPSGIILPASEIRKVMEEVAMIKINGRHKMLPAPKEEDLFNV